MYADSTTDTVILHFDNIPYKTEPILFMKIDTAPQSIKVRYDTDKERELLDGVIRYELVEMPKYDPGEWIISF